MPTRPGKARKSTVITIRLDPKLRFALDLLARKRRRSMTSVIEWALQRAIEDPESGLYEKSASGGKTRDLLERTWDVDEADRFVKLATHCPNLLSFEEERLWKAICENQSFWRSKGEPHLLRIRNEWDNLKGRFEIGE